MIDFFQKHFNTAFKTARLMVAFMCHADAVELDSVFQFPVNGFSKSISEWPFDIFFLCSPGGARRIIASPPPPHTYFVCKSVYALLCKYARFY